MQTKTEAYRHNSDVKRIVVEKHFYDGRIT